MKFNFHSNRFLYSILLNLAVSFIHWVGRTTRWRVRGEENYFSERTQGRPIIFAFWHNQLTLMPFCYTAMAGRKTVTVLISQSRDGQIVSDLIKKFGFDQIRGSSSRGGFSALLQLNRKLEEGFDLAITPDGPRGPAFQVQSGVVSLASASGCSIMPVAYDLRFKKTLKSWDRFKLPRPYNHGVLVVGKPIRVESNADESHLESKRIEVQSALEDINHQAEVLVKK